MKISDSSLLTPIYLKLASDMPWPERERMFYVLTQDGLFTCRNHAFFRSSVPSDGWPGELAPHKPFLDLSYPKLSQRLFETVIGFFAIVATRHDAEAAALFVWNRSTSEVEVVVPEQRSFVTRSSSGRSWPIEVQYDLPTLEPNQFPIGDIHSHVDGAAYASHMDKTDEAYRPGLHVVVGRIFDEPPQFHAEATVDGMRFMLENLAMVTEGYDRRRKNEVPPEWLDRVSIHDWKSTKFHSQPGTGRGGSHATQAPGDYDRGLTGGKGPA